MAEPQNRAQFKAYCFRRLGWPVVQINVDDEQAQDRIDDALAFYSDYHYLGSERALYVHTVTAEDVNTKKITLPEEIITVSNILPPSGYIDSNFMSDRYQFLRSEFFSMVQNVSYSLIPYVAAMTRIEDLDFLFNVNPSIRYHKHKNFVEIVGRAEGILVEGNKIVFETQAVVNPNTYKDIWKDRWLKKYATALIKKQWAENLKLYSGVQLLGGMTLDAQTMYNEAIEEISSMEEKLIQAGSFPVLDEIA